QLYSDDNDDKLPPNDFVYDIISDQPIDDGASWCTNLAPFDANPAGIQGAVLFPYNASISIYHCPADKSTIETRGGTVLAQPACAATTSANPSMVIRITMPIPGSSSRASEDSRESPIRPTCSFSWMCMRTRYSI